MKLSILLLIQSAIFFGGCATTITGTIKSESGRPIASQEARVNIAKLDGDGTQASVEILKPDSQGRFRSNADLSKGRYLIEALVPGHRPASTTIELDGSTQVELIVSPLAAPSVVPVEVHRELDVGRGSGAASLTPPNL